MSERAIALRNMELLEVIKRFFLNSAPEKNSFKTLVLNFKHYLASLTDSVKDHSVKEIERTHHLIAIDNINNLYKNNNLSESEKDEIYERFKS